MRIVENAVGFADIDARKRQVEIQLDLPEYIPDVLADPILIEQVLLNLLKNGVEAMESSDYRPLHLLLTHQIPLIELAVIERGHRLRDSERLFEPTYSPQSDVLRMGLTIHSAARRIGTELVST